ncbi:dnaJ3 (predicted) [Pycnogonum litorale]
MPVNFYNILGLSEDATPSQIKQRYQELILKFHPDKSKSNEVDEFISISKAYKTLIDEGLRKTYDAEIHGSSNGDAFVNEVVPITYFQRNEGEDVYTYDCRCGGEYSLDLPQDGSDVIVPCSTCTLVIKVVLEHS